MARGVLKLKNNQSDNDYVMREDATGVWIEVGEILVHVFHPYLDEGVSVELFANFEGDLDDPIADCYASVEEARFVIEEYERELEAISE